MTTYVMRHQVSAANDRSSPAYGSPEAGLLPIGWEHAYRARPTLAALPDIDIERDWIATSRMRRTQETAIGGGCLNLAFYSQLNEATEGLALDELLQIKPMLAARQTPPCAIDKAMQILENPPAEKLLVTHGLVIVGLCEVLGVSDPSWRFVPNFGELRALPM